MDAVKIRNVYTYTLACKEIIRERKGVVFSYGSSEKWAEAAPLPGRSHESLEDVLHALSRLHKGEPSHLPASLAFALDTLDLPALAAPVEICRLLAGTPQQILQDAKRLQSEGATCVKVKVSGLPIQEAAVLAQELKNMFQLRIDTNRSWTLEEALLFADHFSEEEIEFFEEPLQNPRELAFFPLPFALDESLLEPSIESLLHLPNLRTLVLKPTLLGGKKACLQWIARCRKLGLEWVISSAFESGIGTLQLARLLAVLPSCGTLAGLDSYSFLAEDLLETPLELYGGLLNLPKSLAIKSQFLSLNGVL
jgi:o-succinylbenzoate synthase